MFFAEMAQQDRNLEENRIVVVTNSGRRRENGRMPFFTDVKMILGVAVIRVTKLDSSADGVGEGELSAATHIPAALDGVILQEPSLGRRRNRSSNRIFIIKSGEIGVCAVKRMDINLGKSRAAGGIKKQPVKCKTGLRANISAPLLLDLAHRTIIGEEINVPRRRLSRVNKDYSGSRVSEVRLVGHLRPGKSKYAADNEVAELLVVAEVNTADEGTVIAAVAVRKEANQIYRRGVVRNKVATRIDRAGCQVVLAGQIDGRGIVAPIKVAPHATGVKSNKHSVPVSGFARH